MMTSTDSYDEALTRFHDSGPEFHGWLSNHGPMVVEALARRGADDHVSDWTTGYLRRLDDRPRGRFPIADDDWQDPLGDPTRSGDWIDFFLPRVSDRPWQDLLATWWPRLLPGIAAGATHGVIRTGHAVRALRAGQSEPRRAELAHALAYWAARWQPSPLARPSGTLSDRQALEAVAPIADQTHGVRHRLRQLTDDSGWATTAARIRGPIDAPDVPARLARLVDTTVAAYPRLAPGNPTMLVHLATAPNAVLAALPSLPQELWPDSFAAAWSASAALAAAYRPTPTPGRAPTDRRPTDVPDQAGPDAAQEAWARAVEHGGEHVVKLADTALSAFARTGDPGMLRAIDTAIELDA